MLYCYLGPGRLAVLERWMQLPNTVTISDRFHCTEIVEDYVVHLIILFV